MTDTDEQILERKTELETALGDAQARYSDACARRGEAETARGRALVSVREMKTARAQGKVTDDNVQEMVDWSTVCDEDYKIHWQAANDAIDGVKHIEWQLQTLLAAHPEVFAEQAEQATQAALVAMTAAAKPMRDAQMAYEAAVAAWAPVAQAMGIPGVPAWPLVDPEELANPEPFAPRPAKVAIST